MEDQHPDLRRVMVKADIEANEYKFTIVRLISSRGSKQCKFTLVYQTGNVGEFGYVTSIEFSTWDCALAVFNSIIQDRTGGCVENGVDDFKFRPGKFTIIETIDSCCIQVHLLQHLSTAQIERGLQTLMDIKKELSSTTTNTDVRLLQNLTSQYYTMIPQAFSACDKLTEITSLLVIETEMAKYGQQLVRCNESVIKIEKSDQKKEHLQFPQPLVESSSEDCGDNIEEFEEYSELTSTDDVSVISAAAEAFRAVRVSEEMDDEDSVPAMASAITATTSTANVGSDASKFQCTICYRKFLRHSNLTVHTNMMHRVTAPVIDGFDCDKCDVQFVTNTELEQHLKIHRQQQEYMCTVCGKRYVREFNLQHHIETGACCCKKKQLAGIPSLKLYECLWCGEKFTKPSLYNDHVREMHSSD